MICIGAGPGVVDLDALETRAVRKSRIGRAIEDYGKPAWSCLSCTRQLGQKATPSPGLVAVPSDSLADYIVSVNQVHDPTLRPPWPYHAACSRVLRTC